MINLVKRKSLQISAAFTAGMMMASQPASANNFSDIGQNVITSIASLPGLLSGLAYLSGIILGILGVLKIKDHVENPAQVQLKDGAVRLAAGGALFALPIIYEAMMNTIGTGDGASAAQLNAVEFNVQGGSN